ncbi:glycosyltransferase family 4 protein [Leptospira koniambonensis]|uniref:glycosyltransferase family 4 protein n=1 Tax=Leptospira koniambonensis TaxID=2484950 RepID=UPI001FC9D9E6|nr:glycosyltransferase family 4 protein [Leptospira koniambonensis]
MNKKKVILDKPKIALLGPIPPFRGGISQYTFELQKVLENRSNLLTISFHRQYPGFLYPGKTDLDPFYKGQKLENVSYTIDALDPFSLVKVADSVLKSGCELAILSWWTLFWAPGFAFISSRLRRSGIKTVFLCHNLFDHDSGFLKKFITKILIRNADGYLVHSSEQKEILSSIFPDKIILQNPHPIYEQFPAPKGILKPRGKLELLFFGFIRPYKGLDLLLEALAKLNDPEIYLTVVGESWKDPEELISFSKKLGLNNVEFHLEYTDESSVSEFFYRADLVVLPYRSATGSGVATIAYHYEKPILATRVGGFLDTIIDGETGFLIEPGSSDIIAEKIRPLSRKSLGKMKSSIRNFKRNFTWESMVSKIIEFHSIFNKRS